MQLTVGRPVTSHTMTGLAKRAWLFTVWAVLVLTQVAPLLLIIGPSRELVLWLLAVGVTSGALAATVGRNQASVAFEVPLDEDTLLGVLRRELRAVATQPDQRRFEIRRPTTTFNWGEIITLTVRALSAASTGVTVESRSGLRVSAFDFGGNTRCIKETIERLRPALEHTLAAQQQGLVSERARHRETEWKLQRLQAQSEAHFLFNTLAHVRALVTVDAGRSLQMIDALTDYLRKTSNSLGSADSTLQAELELVRGYLEVMGIRLGERLRVTLEVDPALEGTACLAGVLLPLVENAVKHGIEPSVAGGEVRVSAKRLEPGLQLEVADTGVGFRATSGSGIGLSNLKQRLREWYGPKAEVRLSANSPTGVVVTLELP